MTASQLIVPQQIPWGDGPKGSRWKQLWVDEAGSRRLMLGQFTGPTAMPPHRHDGTEVMFVIEGSIGDEYGLVTAGNSGFRPDGCCHTISTAQGATVLALVAGAVSPLGGEGPQSGPPSRVATAHEIPWVERLPGLHQKTLWEDAAGCKLMMSRFAPGASLPHHRHDGDELLYVLDGTVDDEHTSVGPGCVGYRPNGCEHTVRSPGGATNLAFIWGTVTPL